MNRRTFQNRPLSNEEIKSVVGPAPPKAAKPISKPLEEKPKMEKGAVVEQVNPGQFPDVNITLWSDMERFSNGSMHVGYQLATYGDGKNGGNITAGGNEITVSIKGRLWGVPLETLVELVKAADAQREARLAQ
jgi:hypothetical protein